MEYLVAKTIVFDRNLAIQVREMHRVASDGETDGPSEVREGIFERVSRLIQFRRQGPAAFADCGGALG